MRFLFTRFPLESAFGGAEVQTLSLMDGLRDRGHSVSFLGSCQTLLAECKKRGIVATERDIGPPPVTKRDAVSFLWRRSAMRRALREEIARLGSQDAVLMLSLTEKLLLTHPLHASGTRVVWVEHDRVGRWLRRNPWLPQLRRMSAYATTVTVSGLSRRIYLDLGFPPERVTVIPNGIDLRRFPPSVRPRTGGVPHVGCVARLSWEKGVDVLIGALGRVSGVRATIVGGGPEEGAISRQITEEKLAGRVKIIAPGRDLRDFYQSIDLLVLPSRDHDPFGLVAAEAMALGIPVIVTDACGIAEYCSSGTDAVVVPAGSVSALEEAIAHLRDQPHLRHAIGEAGQLRARQAFGAEHMVDAYEKLLQRDARR